MITSQKFVFSSGGGGGTYRCFLSAALATAAMLFAPQSARAETTLYFRGGTDASNSSSLTGVGDSFGWATTPGGSRAYAGMQANAVHVLHQAGCIGVGGAASISTPAGSTLVVSNRCIGQVVLNSQGGVAVPSAVTIGSLKAVSGATVHLTAWLGVLSPRPCPVWGGTDWFVESGSVLQFALNLVALTGYECTAAVRGEVGSAFRAYHAYYDPATYPDQIPNTLFVKGDMTQFFGDLVVDGDTRKPGYAKMELVNAASIPGNPPDGTTSYVVVTNGATLIVDQDWTSGRNRVWDFGSGEPSTIYVAEGKTVTIKGEVRGSVGFRKSGPGTLVLTKQSPISGACEVISGKVLLQGDAAALKPLFAVYGEYLDAPCGSYINTQYKPNNNTRIVMDLTVQGAREYWYGVWDRAYNNGSFLAANDGASAGVVHFGFGNTFNNGPSLLSNGRHVVDFDKGVLWIDNAGKYEASSTGSFQLSNNLYLFLINNIGTPYVHDDEQGTIRMHSCQIYNNGSLVRDYVPALHNGAWCLYERCGRTYVANSGTGSFNGQLAVLEVGPGPGSVYYIR